MDMYRTQIKRTKVKRISEEPYKLAVLPTKWETLETYDSLGNAEHSTAELLRAMEKGEIEGFKIEFIDSEKRPYTITQENGKNIIKPL